MRILPSAHSLVCLTCRIRTVRRVIATHALPPNAHGHRGLSSSPLVLDYNFTSKIPINSIQDTEAGYARFPKKEQPGQSTGRSLPLRRTSGRNSKDPSRRHTSADGVGSPSSLRNFVTSTNAIELSESQQEHLRATNHLRQRLDEGLKSVPAFQNDPSGLEGYPIDQLLKALPRDGHSPVQQKIIQQLGIEFSGRSFGSVTQELDLATRYGDPAKRTVTDPKAKQIMAKLGVIENETVQTYQPSVASQVSEKPGRRKTLSSLITPPTITRLNPGRKDATSTNRRKPAPIPWTKAQTQTIEAKKLVLGSLGTENANELPQLSFDLSRVLFNPGCVYQLQDPRSRVYNFDPYLEKIMPVKEFNFDALNPYLTSSEDQQLLELAQKHEKRYIGSSSSMTSVLSHFHFLISQWRDLNLDTLSRGFEDASKSFTALGKSPSAIFLRYRDGVYAVDADKEYDEPNLLMSLGKSMEKLLTLEKDDFEKWRRKPANATREMLEEKPESFHYSEQGRFLLRSQLDAYDPRLPGNGYFDLKTRAVAAIRFNIRDTEAGVGYQIRGHRGNWETYEREYYDMMRSTFLKYSLQARMGHMDGIFVAYHNTARIFGFQYIPMSEMDFALHGQSDPCLGDQEFRLSINLMEEIFNLGTEKYPQQSLRIHFETREASAIEDKPYMHIFLEPMGEEEIKTIQSSNKAQFEEFERRMIRGEDLTPIIGAETEVEVESTNDDSQLGASIGESASTDGQLESVSAAGQHDTLPTHTAENSFFPSSASNAANVAYLDKILNSPQGRNTSIPAEKQVLALKLTIQNKINDRPVSRVADITPATRWSIDYKLDQLGVDEGKRLYRICKNRRMGALKLVMNRSRDSSYLQTIRAISERGAEWRRQQDELDAQRETVVLYQDRLK